MENTIKRKIKKEKIFKNMVSNPILYLMVVPGFLWYLIFAYGPIFGITVAFMDYSPYLGFFDSPWVGFDNILMFLKSPMLIKLVRNTLRLSIVQILFGFPAPLILAIMLSEVKQLSYKRIIQTTTYLPHFLSWVVIAGITTVFFSSESGIITNSIYKIFNLKINILSSESTFVPLYVYQNIWKSVGYNAIIYLAAIAGVDPVLYEAATIDGCNRIQKIWHVTLASIKPTIVILLLLRISNIFTSNFEQILMIQNALNINVSQVFSTYIYKLGILNGEYSIATAVGLFSAVVSVVLLLISDRAAKGLGENGIF